MATARQCSDGELLWDAEVGVLYLNSFDSIESLEAGLVEYIQYYNQERIKLKLKGLSPVQYREQTQQAQSAA